MIVVGILAFRQHTGCRVYDGRMARNIVFSLVIREQTVRKLSDQTFCLQGRKSLLICYPRSTEQSQKPESKPEIHVSAFKTQKMFESYCAIVSCVRVP